MFITFSLHSANPSVPIAHKRNLRKDMFIHRPALLGLSEDGIDRAELIIAKNRAGEMGIIPLRFNGDQVRFKEDTGSLSDYASAVPVESAMNSYDITPRPSEGYSPFDHFESGGE